jgi:ribosome-interacting GTPase 1
VVDDDDGPELHGSACAAEREGKSNTVIVGTPLHVKSGLIERLSATTLPLTVIARNRSVMCYATARANQGFGLTSAIDE